jgi:hypothetical protein
VEKNGCTTQVCSDSFSAFTEAWHLQKNTGLR